MRHASAREHVTDYRPRAHPPRLRIADPSQSLESVVYDSENYAMLNRPIETSRHVRRVMRYLRPERTDCLLEVGCGRGWLTQRVQETVPNTWGIDVNPRSIAHAVTDQLSGMDAVALNFDDEQ